MELFKNTRLKIGSIILNGKAARSKRRMIYKNLSLIKSIGIIWDAANEKEFQVLSKFQHDMQKRDIDVQIIGYHTGEYLPNSYTAIRFFSCVRKHEISMFYVPVSDDAHNFMSKKFDILIDINFDKIFTLRYITVLSNALFKVGLFEADSQNNPFDLMMEIKKPVSVENYLEQIIQYLEMINS
jgi:hypothetical protein